MNKKYVTLITVAGVSAALLIYYKMRIKNVEKKADILDYSDPSSIYYIPSQVLEENQRIAQEKKAKQQERLKIYQDRAKDSTAYNTRLQKDARSQAYEDEGLGTTSTQRQTTVHQQIVEDKKTEVTGTSQSGTSSGGTRQRTRSRRV